MAHAIYILKNDITQVEIDTSHPLNSKEQLDQWKFNLQVIEASEVKYINKCFEYFLHVNNKTWNNT